MFVRGPDGVHIPIDCRATPMRNDEGAIVGAVAVVRDLRVEREAQAALRESEARYRDLVEHSGEILTSHTLDGRLLSVNPAMLRSLRMRAKEVPPNLGDLVPLHHRAGFREYLARVQREGRADGVGTRARLRRHAPDLAVPLVDPARGRGRTGRALDRHGHHRRPHARASAGRPGDAAPARAEDRGGGQAGRRASRTTSTTSSRSSPAISRSASDESHVLPSQARADLDEVTRAVDRATRLTRRLLGFSRKQLLAPRVVDVNALIAELEPMLARVLDERIAFAAHPSPTPARINIDPSVLEGALVNLAVNARDAMPNGGTLTVDTTVRGEIGHDRRARQRHGDGSGDAGSRGRAVLHDEGRRRGHGARTGDDLRQRRAVGRIDPDREHAGRGHRRAPPLPVGVG